jgi:hypothetical protein
MCYKQVDTSLLLYDGRRQFKRLWTVRAVESEEAVNSNVGSGRKAVAV